MDLNERIALARKQAGLSQEQLGEKLGVSRQAVSKWEAAQSNPDVAYLAEMCRLFGVSADWLLLGEESAKESAPARCPSCQAIVTGLDKFCPNCGHGLGQANDTYTLLFKLEGLPTYRDVYLDKLCSLSRTGCFPSDSPLGQPIDRRQAQELIDASPCILARGLSVTSASDIQSNVIKVTYPDPDNFTFYRDCDGDDPAVLAARKPVSSAEFTSADLTSAEITSAASKEPLSFGMVVLAVILGVVGAILLLSFL